jgi:phosphoribosylglycinamide formyltransferase-1
LLRVGWFSTGRDEAALTLFLKVYNAIKKGYLEDVEISFVFSNREPGEFPESDRFFDSVGQWGIPIHYLSHRKFNPELRKLGLKESRHGESKTLEKWRETYDRELEKVIQKYKIDLNMLAGYMLIFSEYFVKEHVMLNLHPAPPGGPKGTWQEVIWETIKRRLVEAGCMMHVVTERLDEGPPATYCTFPVIGPKFNDLWSELESKLQAENLKELIVTEGENNQLFRAIRDEEFKRETPLLIETLKASSHGRIKIENRRILIDGKPSEKGLCLNTEIEECLRSKT